MPRKKLKKRKKVIKIKSVKLKPPKKIIESKKSSSTDEKIEIKKIKKQPNQKKEYNLNDYVVYPKHGVGKIVSVDKATIGGIGLNYYKIFIEKDKLTLTIPLNQQNHLRPISSINQINKCVSILKTKLSPVNLVNVMPFVGVTPNVDSATTAIEVWFVSPIFAPISYK